MTLSGLIIHGGHAAPGDPSNPGCADSQGGGIHAEAGTILNLQHSVVQHSTADPGTGGGGGDLLGGAPVRIRLHRSRQQHDGDRRVGQQRRRRHPLDGIRLLPLVHDHRQLDLREHGNRRRDRKRRRGRLQRRPTDADKRHLQRQQRSRGRRGAGRRRRRRRPREGGGWVDRARHILRQPQRPAGRCAQRRRQHKPRELDSPGGHRPRPPPNASPARPTPWAATSRARPVNAGSLGTTSPASMPSSARLR